MKEILSRISKPEAKALNEQIFGVDKPDYPKMEVFKSPDFGNVRSTMINNEPWFVGNDIAGDLGYADPKQAIATHVDPEDRLLYQKGRFGQFDIDVPNRGVIVINEPGVYSLIFGSRLPAAKRFKHWIATDVLPQIRKTGSYTQNCKVTAQFLRTPEGVAELLSLYSSVVNAPTKLEPTFTVTRIARDFGLTAQGLNRILASLGIQHKSNGNWVVTDELADKGYTVTRQYNGYKAMYWTERGI